MKTIVFSITTPVHCNSKSARKTFDELNKSIELRSQNDIELQVEQVGNKGTNFINDWSLTRLGTVKNKIFEEINNSKNNDLEDIVYRFQITYDETIDILDLKCIPTKTIGYILPSGIYQISVINLMLKSLLTNEVKVSITIDDTRLKSNITTDKTINFNKKSFFYTLLGFT